MLDYRETKKTISVVMNTFYFPIFIPLLNSIKMYQPSASIKVYNWCNFNHLVKNYLLEIGVDVVDTYKEYFEHHESSRIVSREKAISIEAGVSPVELYIDVDTVLLSNLDDVFSDIEKGKFICTSEVIFENILGATKQGYQFKTLNGGFLGFNKEKHMPLIQEWSRICKYDADFIMDGLETDQYILSFLISKMLIDTKFLDCRLFMNTFGAHSEPRKILSFEDGFPILRNSDTNSQIRFYHYTGGVGVYNNKIAGRYHHSQGTNFHEQVDFEKDLERIRNDWYELWEKQYHSPVAVLYDYFGKIGPYKCLSVFDYKFRLRVSLLLTELLKKECNHYSKEVIAISIAYDYITSLNYKLKDGGWMESPLKMLINKDINNGEKEIGWKNKKTDISLDFEPDEIHTCWFSKHPEKEQRKEYLYGLNIRINNF